MTPELLLAQDAVLAAGLAVIFYGTALAVLRYRRWRTPWLLAAALVTAAVATVVVASTWPRPIDLVKPAHWERYPGGAAVGIVALLAAAGVAVTAADGLFARVTALIRGRDSAPSEPAARVALAGVAIAVVAAAATVGLLRLLEPSASAGDGPSTATGAVLGTVDATHPLPGGPLGVALTGPRGGYAVLHPDSVVRFDMPDGDGDMALTTLITGLNSPRGIAVANGHLFVTELQGLPCPDPAAPRCLEDATPAEAELATIAATNGRIVRYPLLGDGTLGDPEVVIDGLPVASYDHGVNALIVGADGRIYASIGGFGDLSLYPDLAATIDHERRDLFGTIVSFEPDGSDLRVFARGLRNVYGLAFSPDGHLYAADNDGEALNALRAEELVRIVEGGHYGFPDDGSYAPFTVRTEFALWHLDQVASAGIAWSVEPQGVMIGGLSRVQLVELGTRPGAAGLLVGSRSSVKRVANVAGYATTVDFLGDGRLLVGVFNPWAPEENAFLVISLPAAPTP